MKRLERTCGEKIFHVTPLMGKCWPPAMPVSPKEETHGDLLGELEQEQDSNVLCKCVTCGTSLQTYKLGEEADQQATVEPVLVAPTTSTMPAILASHVSSPISSQILKIKRGMYMGSLCTLVYCTAKMVVAQILGES